jgi:hypothetical protein
LVRIQLTALGFFLYRFPVSKVREKLAFSLVSHTCNFLFLRFRSAQKSAPLISYTLPFSIPLISTILWLIAPYHNVIEYIEQL